MLALHLTTAPGLADARAAGDYRISSHGLRLDDVGFVHLCTPAQLPGVAERFYSGVDDLVVLVVDLDACEAAGSPVRWEPASDAGGELFPHVHGPLPWAAIRAELRPRLEAGRLTVDGLEEHGLAEGPPPERA